MKVYLLYISKLLKLFKLKGGKYIAEKKKFEIKFLENFKKWFYNLYLKQILKPWGYIMISLF